MTMDRNAVKADFSGCKQGNVQNAAGQNDQAAWLQARNTVGDKSWVLMAHGPGLGAHFLGLIMTPKKIVFALN